MAGQLTLDDRWTEAYSQPVPPSLAAGELRRGLAGGDPRKRIAQPALLVGSLRDPTLTEAEKGRAARGGAATKRGATPGPVLCASCQGREARYGFRADTDDPQVERPRTLCFECFRAEIARRQEAARAVQFRLPLEETLDALSRRRRRAQIAARHALAVSGF